MNASSDQSIVHVIQRAARKGAQPRLLLLWVILLGLPTLLMALPLYRLFGPVLSHSLSAKPLATKLNGLAVTDLSDIADLSGHVLSTASLAAVILALIFSPWLNGLALSAARAPLKATFTTLIAGANAQYWAMVRMGLWSLIPVGLVLALNQGAAHWITKANEQAILASSTRVAHWSVLALVLVLYALVQCSIEAGRAQLAADPRRHSVVRAWWAGLRLLVRHPIRVFGIWLLITLPALLAVALLMLIRVNLDQGTAIGLIIGLILAELVVLSLSWMRNARLCSLVDLVIHSYHP